MKYFITLTVLAFSFQCSAQFTKGTKVLGGSLSVHTTGAPNSSFVTKSSQFSIIPSAGVFVNEKIEVGAQAGYSINSWETALGTSNSNQKYNNLVTGIYAQRYFSLSEKFFFTLQGSFNYTFGTSRNKFTNTTTSEVLETKSTSNSFELAVAPRFVFFPSQNWAVQAEFGRLGYRFTKNGDGDHHEFNVNYNSIGLGVAYYLRK